MSRSITCDNCGETLILNDRGDDENGEIALWVTLEVLNERLDCCTRQCAHEMLDRPEFIEAVEERAAAIADIARIIREERDEDGEDEP